MPIFFLPFLPLRLMLSKKNYCVFVIEFFFLGMDTAVKTGNVMHENDSNSFRINANAQKYKGLRLKLFQLF
jgi:hypothetical protein